MDRKLLLLGLLRNQEMHGYRLNEHLGANAGMAITLKKSTAYNLLNKMEKDGWISHHEEREGNRPPRRVYTITAEGEAAFQRILRKRLALYPTPQLPCLISLSFLDVLPKDEALSLLQERRQQIASLLEEVHGTHTTHTSHTAEGHFGSGHLGLVYIQRFYVTELEWLDEVIRQLSNESAINPPAHQNR